MSLLLPDVGDDFFSPLLGSIAAGAEDAGYDLLIAVRCASKAIARHSPRTVSRSTRRW